MEFLSFKHRQANFRISSSAYKPAVNSIIKNRTLLDEYIRRDPVFKTSLAPVELKPGAPFIVQRMHQASLLTGVGPMAAVAGIFAELAGQEALAEGIDEVVVENGGDIFLKAKEPVYIGVYAGDSPLSGRFAFRIDPASTPLGICSSSGTLGHSFSFGKCDLATVFSRDTALADAAATLAGNLVSKIQDIDSALEWVGNIPGILGVVIIKEERIGMLGSVPELVKQEDPKILAKITKDPSWGTSILEVQGHGKG